MTDFANFGDIVSDVLSTAKTDPIQHMLVLTYEFDEQQLVNLVCSRNLEDDFELRQAQLKILSNLRPLVIYDARKTKAFSKIPQFLELHPFKTPGFSCHHSKAYLIITEKTVRLVLGSFNLTMTGLFRNREVFESFHWDAQQTSRLEVLKEWTQFFEEHYQGRLAASSQSALFAIVDALKTRGKAWIANQDDDSMHLLYSGYDNTTGINALRRHWDRWFPGTEPDSLLAVSPFFDESPQNKSLARDLQNEFPSIQAMTLITDESANGSLSQAHFGSIQTNELLLIPAELSAHEHERIERLASQTGNSTKDQRFFRKLHAKVLMLQSGSNAMLYMGSANFSQKAWQGNNQELGVVSKEADPAGLRDSLILNLGAIAENRYKLLPLFPPEKDVAEDDEAYDNTDFPGFIEMIVLTPNSDHSRVRFLFEAGDRVDGKNASSLDDYVVQWSDIRLDIQDHCSQWIERKEFQNRMISARNISFKPVTNMEQVFWFPFQYAGELIAERETFLHPSSWDWIAFYLNPNQGSVLEPGEFLPGEAKESTGNETAPLYTISREENCVIAMQGYLTLFTRVERDFHERVNNLESVTLEYRSRSLALHVIEPLKGFCRLLEQEANAALKGTGAKQIAPADVFKMGELLLLANSLSEKLSCELRTAFKPLQVQIQDTLKSWNGNNDLQAAYLGFVIDTETV